MTGYEITRDFDDVLAYFWRASHQQVYRELARLSRDGCVTHELIEQAGKPNKKVYRLTERGRAELERWVEAETEPPPPRYDLLVKLLAAPAVGRKKLLREIERQQAFTSAVLAEFRAKRDVCRAMPRQRFGEHEEVLYLALRRGLLLVEAQSRWLEETREYFETGALEERVPRKRKRAAERGRA
jgi:DNA-binding PadR family transcriptional regulator